MSGHSKWAQIKRQKGVADIKRGQAFTKVAKGITIAVKQGGGVSDPSQNFRLRLAIEKARAINMPKENIERAIERGMGKSGGMGLEESVYEGFGPQGVAVIVEAATDNKQRTTPEIKSVFEKNGGTLATPGAVSYQFEQKGLITVKKGTPPAGRSLDDIFLISADAGAEDIEEAGDEVLIYTKPDQIALVKDILVKNNLAVKDLELIRKPKTTISITDRENADKMLALVEKLEELEDVQKVYANFDIPDRFLTS